MSTTTIYEARHWSLRAALRAAGLTRMARTVTKHWYRRAPVLRLGLNLVEMPDGTMVELLVCRTACGLALSVVRP